MLQLTRVLERIDAFFSSIIPEIDDIWLVAGVWLALLVGPLALWSSGRYMIRSDRRYVVGTLLLVASMLNVLSSCWFLYAHGLELVRASFVAAGVLFVAILICIVAFPLCLLGSQIRAALESRRPRYIFTSVLGLAVIAVGLIALAQHVAFKEVLIAAGLIVGCLFTGFLNHFFVPEGFEGEDI